MVSAVSPAQFVERLPPVRPAPRWWWPNSWRGLAVHAMVLPVALSLFLSACEWFGRSQLWWGALTQVFLMLFGSMYAAIGVLIAPFFLHHAARLFVWGAVTAAFAFVALIVPLAVRTAAFARCAERARPLIDAIDRFARERGAVPQRLEDLVPVYLPAVPGSGMPAYPVFDYLVGDGDADQPTGGYELRLPCDLMWLSDDVFVYWPAREYPEQLYSGHTRRIGDWAYVHVD